MSSTEDSTSSRPSLAIIITCSAVGGVVVIFLFVRLVICIHRRRVLKPRPLPPARPLTMHEGSYSAYATQSQLKLNEGFYDSVPSIGVYPSTDRLVSQNQSPLLQAGSLSRHQSRSTEEAPLRQSSPATPMSGDREDHQLVPPQPLFFVTGNATGTTSNRSSAQVSLASVTEESDPGSVNFQRPVSLAHFPSSAQPPEILDPEQYRFSVAVSERPPSPNRRPKPHRQNRHSLAASMTSMRTAETMKSMRSVRSSSYIRGAPHNPQNRIEIVLPAPLAPHVYSQTTGGSAEFPPSADPADGYYAEPRSRRQSTISYSDPWINVGREVVTTPARPSSSDKTKLKKEARRASQPRSSRLSLSSSSSHATPSPSTSNTSPSNAQSSTPSQLNPSPRMSTLDSSALPPPVPPVPSMYSTTTDLPLPLPLSISQPASRENLCVETPDDASSSTRSFHIAPEAFASTSTFHDAVEEQV